MATTLKYRFAMRRRTASEWTSVNEVLLNSEWGYESDTGKLKIGNGTAVWTSLAYVSTTNIPEGTNKYFTNVRVSTALDAGAGITLTVDPVTGVTEISSAPPDTGQLLNDWTGVQLTDWSGTDLQDWSITTAVTSFKARVGAVVPALGDYTTDMVAESGTPTNQWFTASRVRAVVLTGLSTATNAAIVAGDTLLAALGKLQAQITVRQIIGQPVKLPTYTLITLPSAATFQDCLIVCTNLTEGRRVVYSDGTNWRRLTDNTVAS
jgi:hypothetical protein